MRRRSVLVVGPLALVGVLALAACGGSSGAPSSSADHDHRTAIGNLWNDAYGWIVVGPDRHALYMFCPDGRARCTGTHDPDFPALIARGRVVAAPTARQPGVAAPRSRIRAGKLGAVRLKSGRRQVTYYGQPLYLYGGDQRPGHVAIHGESKHRDQWSLIDPGSGRRALPSSY